MYRTLSLFRGFTLLRCVSHMKGRVVILVSREINDSYRLCFVTNPSTLLHITVINTNCRFNSPSTPTPTPPIGLRLISGFILESNRGVL